MARTGVILALDLATVLGVAIGPAGGKPRAVPHRIAPPETAIGPFLSRYADWLADQITTHDPAVIIFEAPIMTAGKTSIDTARKLMNLAGLTDMIGWRREVPRVFEADSSTVCKAFTGRGRYEDRGGKKRAVMEACARLGWEAADDNAADALALWWWAETKLFPKARRESDPLLARGAA